ncbi:aTP-dependent helicase [Prevotella sp. CAG:279]|nr:aTP-dependent helicase [Prevotella sp. CAG:279]
MILINKASAGSGKTYTLVKEYLIMLLGKKTEGGNYILDKHPNDNHRYILAITFTNKATEEMKSRIVETLDVLASNPDESPYITDLTTMLGASKDDISKSAGIAERQMLEDYTNFNVCTIDTFFQKILRTFAYEVNLSSNYGVELNDEYVVELGVNNLKTRLHDESGKKNKSLSHWLWMFVQDSIKNGSSWDVFYKPKSKKTVDNSLYNFAKVLTNEVVKKNSKQLFDFLADPKNIQAFNVALNSGITNLISEVKECVDEIFKMLEGPGIKANKNFTNFLDALNNSANPFLIKDLDKKVGKKIADQSFVNKNSASVNDIAICDCLTQILDNNTVYASYKKILDLTYQLGLLGDINASMQDFTNENNTILLSGTNDIVKRIIDGCETPFIYERIGMYLHNFLLDEFQDTSRMQWENLLPLVRNGLANGHDSLIIGDVKQSIYRFRNSDPQLLHSQLKVDFSNDSIKYNEGRSINWRSARNIVHWNNAFFQFLSMALNMDEFYADVEQKVSPKNEKLPGHVVVARREIPDKKKDTDGSNDCEIKNDDNSNDNDSNFKEWAIEKMIVDLQSLLARGFKQKDIAVLSNTNREGQLAISRIMKWNIENPDKQMKVVSEESLLVISSPAVRIVVNILKMLDRCEAHNEDGREMPMVLRRFEANRSEGMDTSEAFEDAIVSKDEDIADYIDRLYETSKSACLDSVVEQIIKSQLSKQMTEENTPYLLAFLDSVVDFMSRYGSNIHHFLKWWDKVGPGLSISSPDNIDAIRVITIHKSKGLQFPCVLIPMFDWNFDQSSIEWIETAGFKDKLPKGVAIPPIVPVKRDNKSTLFDKEFKKIARSNIMDSLNKTYVACTRAQYELIIYTENNKELGLQLSQFLETCRNNDISPTPTENCDPDVVYELGKPMLRSDIPALNSDDNALPDNVESRIMPPYSVVSDVDRWKLTSPDIIIDVRGTTRWVGEMLHKVMERVRTPKNLKKAFGRALHRGMITEEEHDEYLALLSKRLADPRVADWFANDNRLMLERSVTIGGNGQKRPDRVVMKPNGEIIIVDYKFGDRSDDNDTKYKRQVAGYKRAVCDALGCRPDCVSGYVWYIHSGDILAV